MVLVNSTSDKMYQSSYRILFTFWAYGEWNQTKQTKTCSENDKKKHVKNWMENTNSTDKSQKGKRKKIQWNHEKLTKSTNKRTNRSKMSLKNWTRFRMKVIDVEYSTQGNWWHFHMMNGDRWVHCAHSDIRFPSKSINFRLIDHICLIIRVFVLFEYSTNRIIGPSFYMAAEEYQRSNFHVIENVIFASDMFI